MDKGAEQDPVTKLTIEMAQTNGYLKSHVANQEKTNTRLLKLLDRVMETQAAMAERLAVTESQAACVPDLYKGQAKTNKMLWMGAGAIVFISIITAIIGPALSPVLAKIF